ncbi:MAG: D-alanine--D-alanine ligase [Coriobacteriia bacterium]|nr:D-alanine--D-alanine ligase [Coriobacteriia bacterium]
MLNPAKIRIVVLQGGISAEREVSLRSGENCSKGLVEAGFQVSTYDAADLNFIDELRKSSPDLVFNALHGKYGEDGTMQGLLEVLGIPYTGSGVLASALAMDKHASKGIYEQAALPTPRGVLLSADDLSNLQEGDMDALYQQITEQLKTRHLAVKPNSEGSSVGVSLIDSAADFPQALRLAMSNGETCVNSGHSIQSVLIEECIKGKEITVGVLGGTSCDVKALPVIEIKPKDGFYHFENKYAVGGSDFVVPAGIDAEMTHTCQELAVRAHKVLGCHGYSRSDIRLASDGRPYLLETNTLPGLTENSLIPRAAACAGIEFADLLLRIVDYALSK